MSCEGNWFCRDVSYHAVAHFAKVLFSILDKTYLSGNCKYLLKVPEPSIVSLLIYIVHFFLHCSLF